MFEKDQNVWPWTPAAFSAGAARPLEPRPPAVPGDSVRVVWSKPAGFGGNPNETKQRHFRGRGVQLLYALIDVCILIANGLLAFLLRYAHGHPLAFFKGKLGTAVAQPYISHEGFLCLYIGLVLLFSDWQDLYRTSRTRTAYDESVSVVKAVFFATLLVAAFIYLSGDKFISRLIVVGCLILNSVALCAWRYAKRRFVLHRALNGAGLRNAIIIGAGEVGRELARQMEENKLLGYQFKGFLDSNHTGDPRTLGKIEDLPSIARSQFLDEVFITIPSERELVKRIAIEGRKNRLDVKVIPELYDGLCWNAPIQQVGEFPVMEVHWRAIPTLGLFVKRVADVVLSSLALLIFSPLLAVLAVAIRMDSEGPALYRSQRIGRKGLPFTCFKFRTMVLNADDLKESLRNRNERSGPFFKITEDPRITRLGRFLRKYSLDELPQLWNVLRSDMTLVGPRPHPMDDYRQYTLDHLRRLEVKPGITGLWQTTARQDPSFDTNMNLDLEYIENWSLWLDCKILLTTIPAVFRAEGS
jgi:exopolysaccharide biosynthesis polyprenyl glycosylphosphotransferase